ncbi:MAG: ACT domain-containing protein [Clostridia bacterium]|nr:ACT domain-containing protein [Clostridia bacterium]
MKLVDNIFVTEDVTLFSLCDAPADIEHMAEVFKMIADAGIDVDMISQFPSSGSGSGFSFTVNDKDFVPVLSIASELRTRSPKTKISVSSGNCKITVSGEEMRGTPGVSARIFKATASVNADVRMITTSEIEISLLVVKSDVDNVIEAIKAEF